MLRMKIALLLSMICSLNAEMKLEQIASFQPATFSMIDRTLHAMLEDSSCFAIKIMPEKRSRYFSEWLYDVKPVEWQLDASFFCDPTKWTGFFEVALYSVLDSPFPGYDFALKNTHNGQMVFAKLQPFQSVLIPKILFAERFFSKPLRDASEISISNFQNSAVIGLEDNRFYKIIPTSYRFRTFWEWMTSEQIEQPDDCFIFDSQSWRAQDVIQVYESTNYPDYLRTRMPKNFSRVYLIENKSTGKMAYANAYSLKELIFDFEQKLSKAQKDGYDQGYQYGYNKGYQYGYSQGKKDADRANLDEQIRLRNPTSQAPNYQVPQYQPQNPTNSIDEDPS